MGKAIPAPERDYGRRLLTSIIDDTAKSNPEKTFMSIPAGDSVTDGQRDISYGQMAQAINCCAWFIANTLGRGIDFPPIATYMSPMDFRHAILIFGSIKAGYKMFYSSPRNRPDVQVALLEKLRCTTLFTPKVMSETTKAVLEKRHMDKYILPDLDFFISQQESVEPFPYSMTFDEARHNPYVVLHSSGSTGTPKVLILKQGSAAAHDAFQLLPSLGAAPWWVSSWTGKRVTTNFPWVHAGGVHTLSSSIYNDYVAVIPAAWPLLGADANHLHVHGNIQAAWYSPSVLVDISRDQTFLKNISRLESVSYSGGMLHTDIANAIAKHTLVFGSMASTETGILPSPVPTPELWNHFRFDERLGHTFRHFEDDLYELVHIKDKSKELFQGTFFTLAGAETYEMRDLYIQHPAHPGWWRSSGRIDDVVVMADAKKLNAVPYEAVIERNPGIGTALICGTGRVRPAVLVQPSQWPTSEQEERNFIDAVWPDCEKANEAGPVFGRLIKELIVVVKQAKPMERAGGKDTVMRKRSIQLYQAEIDEAYRRSEQLGLLYDDATKGQLV